MCDCTGLRVNTFDGREVGMLKCKCGGEFCSIDPVYEVFLPEVTHACFETRRITPGVATRQCNKCGKVREQKLRISKK